MGRTDEATLVARVLDLAAEAERVDGAPPFNDDTLRALRSGDADVITLDDDGLAAPGAAGVDEGDAAPRDPALQAVAIAHDGVAELVVAPGHRRRGLGTRLAERLRRVHPAASIWAHGRVPGSNELAARLGMRLVRELVRMERPITSADAGPAPLPERLLRVSEDAATVAYTSDREREWLDVNARAFAWHPEQGRVTADAFAAQRRERWHRDENLLLLVERGRVTGFNWLKVDSEGPDPRRGEIYVLGVDPERAGGGRGDALMRAGLAHLAELGMTSVDLYSEGDNEPALALYRKLGFEVASRDALFAPPESAAKSTVRSPGSERITA